MSLIDLLDDDKLWDEYLNHKINQSLLPTKVIEQYQTFINSRKYKTITSKMVNDTYTFNYPTKVLISKMGKSKKRIVYMYNDEEKYILKLLSYLLYKYDYLFAPNLYSFRKQKGVKQAIYDLTKDKKINNIYAYKVDIANYFNSIPISQLLPDLKQDLQDDKLYTLLEQILTNKYVIYNNQIIEDINKGIMAGVPISAFLANYYLKDLDTFFYNQKIRYARYADDIIVFDENKKKLNEYIQYIKNYLNQKGLSINQDKEAFYNKGDAIPFLGFVYHQGIIDINDNAKRKIKGKIRRSARGLRRWMIKNNASNEVTIKAINRKFNRKFYGKQENELTWKYWFFKTINTTNSLKDIDQYLQDYERYIITGVHNKKNLAKVPYSFLKQCNYRPLVAEYYKDKKNNYKN